MMGQNSPKPRITLILGAAGSGKTQWLCERFLESLGKGLMVVATEGEAERHRNALAIQTGYAVLDFKQSVLPFRDVVRLIATHNFERSPVILSRAFQRLIVEDICQRHIHAEDFLGQMRDSRGFVGELIARLREWKLACITPEAMAQSATRLKERGESESSVRKTQEFARLFGAYEAFLRENGLSDSEDILRIATERLANRLVIPGSASVVLVDGFFRLNRAQIALLKAMASSSGEVELVLTLPYDPERPLLFAASERTLHTLRQEFETNEVLLPSKEIDSALSHLERRLFSFEATRDPIVLETEEPVLVFDAPNNYVEAEMVAREFQRLYDRGGYAWGEFMVVLRTQGEYAPILASVFERYEVPLGIDGSERLTENPLVKTLLSLLRIVQEGWQRGDVLAFLKSSYTLPDKLEADVLRRKARGKRVREGRERWLGLVEEEVSGFASVKATLERVASFEDSLTRSYASPLYFVERIRFAVEAFGMLELIDQGEAHRASRDRAVWKAANEVLEALAQMALIAGQTAVSQAQFFEALESAWANTSALAESGGDCVRVVEPYETRGFPARVVAVMGLTERVFPRKITEDPFFRDAERRVLRQEMGFDLEEQRGRADDERLLFYFAVTASRQRLILSFPRTADESDALPSFYLDEVRDVFAKEWERFLVTVSRTLADVTPRSDEVVSDGDRLLSACANLFEPGRVTSAKEVRKIQGEATALLREVLQREPERVLRILRSHWEPSLPRVGEAELREAFGAGKQVYSVSELETYRRCPFQYLMRYVWRLHRDEDGANPRTQGTLLHSVLRRYFRGKREREEPIPSEAEALVTELRAVLKEVLEGEEMDAVLHRIAMLERMLWDALEGFALRETRFAPLFKMTPTYFELAFGMEPGGSRAGEDDDREAGGVEEVDVLSTAKPLELRGRDGKGLVRVCGVVDRVDLDSTGTYALAMDYKLGAPPEPSAMERGESLQLPLYLLALERVFGMKAGVGCYDSVQQTARPRLYLPQVAPPAQFRPTPGETGVQVKALNRTQYEELLRVAELTAVDVVQEMERAEVFAKPGKYCGFCPYGDICRTTLAGGHDGEALSLPE